ncbi:Transposable element P transposase [Frankliniella fusca]|uniref:Transposable element P transposase n=1 Tax=Frankliniella fusca TaxID=407009 RepID=A0AAE1HT97_9NEOP|nr:Transposable element P transposase [Frankliniella fusca]
MSDDLFSDGDFPQFVPTSYDVGGGVIVFSPNATDAAATVNRETGSTGTSRSENDNIVDVSEPATNDCQQGETRRSRKRPKNSRSRRIGKPPKKHRLDKEGVNLPRGETADSSTMGTDGQESVDSTVMGVGVQQAQQNISNDGVAVAADNEGAAILEHQKKYRKRRNQVTSKRKKKEKTKQESVQEASAERELITVNLSLETEQDSTAKKKRYKKRKGRFSVPVRRSKQQTTTPLNDESENILNVSMAVVDNPDGDDHLEYDFIRLSQNDEISSSPADLLKKNSDTEGLALQALANDVTQLLSDLNSPWTVDITKDCVCRLTLMTLEPNAAVERTIVWSFQGMEIYIHNKPLPDSHFLVDLELPDSANLSTVAQFLVQHTSVVESANICEGVTSYENYWSTAEEKGVGYIEADIYGGKSCFRNKSCPLIFMDKKRCHKCDSVRDRFKDRKRRVTYARGKDSRKINNRYLPRLSLLGKTQDLAREKRKLNLSIRYLKKKMRKFIAQDTMSLDRDTSTDLCKIFKANMTIYQGIVTTKSGEMVGFTSPTEVEKSVADLEAQLQCGEMKREKAKKVLAFMLQGISNIIHEVIAIYPTAELNSQQLYVRAWDVICSLEIRDIRVLSLIFDGASCNKKFVNMHTKWDSSGDFIHATRNIAAEEERPLFFIVDPPHLLKCIRNCFSNSFGHKCTRYMYKNGEKISWEAIELLHSISIKDKFKTHKLTQAHAKLTAFSRMNVTLTTQTMSKSVARALKDYMNDPRFNGVINFELLSFILKVNTFFDCLNGSGDPDGTRNKTNEYLKPYINLEDERLRTVLKEDVLKFFIDWHNDAYEQEGLSKEAMERRTISHETYQSLHITIFGFCAAVEFLLRKGAPSVDAKAFNQDKLEQYFGLTRMAGGASNNPSYNIVRGRLPGDHAKKAAAPPKRKGNTKGARSELQVNQDPLPCRPRKR